MDFRWPLIGFSALLFARTRIFFKAGTRYWKMPLLIGLIAVAFAIWIAENIGTYARAWAYPNQEHGWQMVHLGKLSAWYLLMMLSFVLVSLVQSQSLREGGK
jgi:uncharacterized membrane protein YoaT (DUF817 family)